MGLERTVVLLVVRHGFHEQDLYRKPLSRFIRQTTYINEMN